MEQEKSRGNSSDRTRNWNFILYPESAPPGWEKLVEEMHIQWVCSPLHDKDMNQEEEPEQKKPHYHITLLYPSHKTFDQVRELTAKLNATIPQKCQSVKGSVRYMMHLDNPEKHQYPREEVRCFGGVQLDDLLAATATERLQIQREILAYIRDQGMIEFEDIVNHALDAGLSDWLNVLLNYSTISVNAYLRSRRNKATFAGVRIVVADTGEVAALQGTGDV